jgi:hypothetical protein
MLPGTLVNLRHFLLWRSLIQKTQPQCVHLCNYACTCLNACTYVPMCMHASTRLPECACLDVFICIPERVCLNVFAFLSVLTSTYALMCMFASACALDVPQRVHLPACALASVCTQRVHLPQRVHLLSVCT